MNAFFNLNCFVLKIIWKWKIACTLFLSKEKSVNVKLPQPRSNTPKRRQSNSQDTHCPGWGQTPYLASWGEEHLPEENIKQVILSHSRPGGECLKHRLNLIVVTQSRNKLVLNVMSNLEGLRLWLPQCITVILKNRVLCKHFLCSGYKTTSPDKLPLSVILLSLKIWNLHFYSHLATDSSRGHQVALAFSSGPYWFIRTFLLGPSAFSCLKAHFPMLRCFKTRTKTHLKMKVLRHSNKFNAVAFSVHPTPIFAFSKNGKSTKLYFYLKRMQWICSICRETQKKKMPWHTLPVDRHSSQLNHTHKFTSLHTLSYSNPHLEIPILTACTTHTTCPQITKLIQSDIIIYLLRSNSMTWTELRQNSY